MNDRAIIADILDYWFGLPNEHGVSPPDRHALWFGSSAATDEHLRQHYGGYVSAALASGLVHWTDQPGGLVALVLLLDQFTRNIYRGTPGAFSGDARALSLAQSAVAHGIDRNLPTIHRVFLYIPYEHSEDLAIQDRGVALFERLLADCHPAAREEMLGYHRYAVAHRDVIARFGRFPHRNGILGRQSTVEELSHLEQHGGF